MGTCPKKSDTTGNVRNGHGQKTLKGEQGHVAVEVPRDWKPATNRFVAEFAERFLK